MKKITVLVLILSPNIIFAQTYNDFAKEIFFGRLPSAKTEAMGRILTLNLDQYFVSQSNPANLSNSQGINIFYSNCTPYYLLDNATYNYFGISYNHPVLGALAFNYLNFNSGIEYFNENKYLYTITYSYNIRDWFMMGISANLFVYDFGFDKNYSSSFFELGLSRNFKFIQNSSLSSEINLASQIKNIFNQSFSAIDENQSDPFPSVFRIGIGNTIRYLDKAISSDYYLVGFTLGFEYQDLFNSSKKTAYKIGSEISVFDVIFLRGGYYYETPFEYLNTVEKIEEFTYGAGLKLDFGKLFHYDFPIIMLADYTNLKQPSYITDYNDWKNFSVITIIINYTLN